jgi:DNA polymerase-1
MTRTLLVDADLLAYRASAATQRSYAFDGPEAPPAVVADLDEATTAAEEALQRLIDRLQPDEVTVCLSDDLVSWRHDRVDPAYKAHRTAERPLQLYGVKDWLRETYDVAEIPTLEADDVMGIIATDPSRTDERIIVSADKDMMTIPGLLYRPHLQLDAQGKFLKEPRILEISPLEAIRFHFWQAIVGDTTDGYPGAPGVGPKSPFAEDVLEAECEEEAWWEVLMAFHKAGLDETDAIRQARLARILQFEDFDGRPILWNPPFSQDFDGEC